jgi:hypothetical protein
MNRSQSSVLSNQPDAGHTVCLPSSGIHFSERQHDVLWYCNLVVSAIRSRGVSPFRRFGVSAFRHFAVSAFRRFGVS